MKDSGNAPSDLQSSRSYLAAATVESFQDVHSKVLSKMNHDEVHLIIRNDDNLLMYGAVLMQKKERDRYSDIRYWLRCIGKLLLEFRKISGEENARSNELVMPENYNNVVTAAKVVSGFSGPREIKTPSCFLKLGFCLKTLAECVRCVALKECNQPLIDKLRNFLELYSTDWQIYATNARATYESRKGNKPEMLPLEEDIKLFWAFVTQEINQLISKIESGINDLQNLKDLSKYLLARIMTYNARRGGEVSKLKLDHWNGVVDGRWKNRTDIDQLDDVEKKLSERLEICYIEGKKKKGGRSNALVPILFTEETVQGIKLLVANRAVMEIKEENDYVFASGDFYLRGWDTLQGITKKVEGLQSPHLITPTRARKYLATMLQLLDMNDAELTWLTNHFGHTKNVHHSWYRREDATIEVTRVAKVLEAVDHGENVKSQKIDSLTSNENSNIPALEDESPKLPKRPRLQGKDSMKFKLFKYNEIKLHYDMNIAAI